MHRWLSDKLLSWLDLVLRCLSANQRAMSANQRAMIQIINRTLLLHFSAQVIQLQCSDFDDFNKNETGL